MSAHDCVRQVNDLLASNNTEISVAISFSTPRRELIQLATNKANQSKRGKPVPFFASYCPFCGISLATKAPS